MLAMLHVMCGMPWTAALAISLVLSLTFSAGALTLPELLAAPPALRQTPIPTPAPGCCRVCTRGKACGNTCIARNLTCHVGPGCACNG
jgi:hypothetical protein